ncbi:hypothetical protein HK101_000878, partial [Irineochytrium annulatum]
MPAPHVALPRLSELTPPLGAVPSIQTTSTTDLTRAGAPAAAPGSSQTSTGNASASAAVSGAGGQRASRSSLSTGSGRLGGVRVSGVGGASGAAGSGGGSNGGRRISINTSSVDFDGLLGARLVSNAITAGVLPGANGTSSAATGGGGTPVPAASGVAVKVAESRENVVGNAAATTGAKEEAGRVSIASDDFFKVKPQTPKAERVIVEVCGKKYDLTEIKRTVITSNRMTRNFRVIIRSPQFDKVQVKAAEYVRWFLRVNHLERSAAKAGPGGLVAAAAAAASTSTTPSTTSMPATPLTPNTASATLSTAPPTPSTPGAPNGGDPIASSPSSSAAPPQTASTTAATAGTTSTAPRNRNALFEEGEVCELGPAREMKRESLRQFAQAYCFLLLFTSSHSAEPAKERSYFENIYVFTRDITVHLLNLPAYTAQIEQELSRVFRSHLFCGHGADDPAGVVGGGGVPFLRRISSRSTAAGANSAAALMQGSGGVAPAGATGGTGNQGAASAAHAAGGPAVKADGWVTGRPDSGSSRGSRSRTGSRPDSGRSWGGVGGAVVGGNSSAAVGGTGGAAVAANGNAMAGGGAVTTASRRSIVRGMAKGSAGGMRRPSRMRRDSSEDLEGNNGNEGQGQGQGNGEQPDAESQMMTGKGGVKSGRRKRISINDKAVIESTLESSRGPPAVHMLATLPTVSSTQQHLNQPMQVHRAQTAGSQSVGAMGAGSHSHQYTASSPSMGMMGMASRASTAAPHPHAQGYGNSRVGIGGTGTAGGLLVAPSLGVGGDGFGAGSGSSASSSSTMHNPGLRLNASLSAIQQQQQPLSSLHQQQHINSSSVSISMNSNTARPTAHHADGTAKFSSTSHAQQTINPLRSQSQGSHARSNSASKLSTTKSSSSSSTAVHSKTPSPQPPAPPPKVFNETIFKIKATEGYIASNTDHISFRKGQLFYEDTECYFVSTQYATPFARTAVCGLVPEKYFETVSLNGKDPPHPSPPRNQKKLQQANTIATTTPSQVQSLPKADPNSSQGPSALMRSKSAVNLTDSDKEFLERYNQQIAEGKKDIKSSFVDALRKRGKSITVAPAAEIGVGAVDERQRNHQPQQQQSQTPPRRGFTGAASGVSQSTTSVYVGNNGSLSDLSMPKRQTSKGKVLVDKLFGFSGKSDGGGGSMPGSPTTTSRHDVPPVPQIPSQLVPSASNASIISNPPNPNTAPHPPRPATPPVSTILSAVVVEAQKQPGHINQTRFIINVIRSGGRVTSVSRSYEDFIHLHAMLPGRTTAAGRMLTADDMPILPAQISNATELRRQYLLDARLQTQMAELGTYMSSLVHHGGGIARALEFFLTNEGMAQLQLQQQQQQQQQKERDSFDSGLGAEERFAAATASATQNRSRSKSDASFLPRPPAASTLTRPPAAAPPRTVTPPLPSGTPTDSYHLRVGVSTLGRRTGPASIISPTSHHHPSPLPSTSTLSTPMAHSINAGAYPSDLPANTSSSGQANTFKRRTLNTNRNTLNKIMTALKSSFPAGGNGATGGGPNAPHGYERTAKSSKMTAAALTFQFEDVPSFALRTPGTAGGFSSHFTDRDDYPGLGQGQAPSRSHTPTARSVRAAMTPTTAAGSGIGFGGVSPSEE